MSNKEPNTIFNEDARITRPNMYTFDCIPNLNDAIDELMIALEDPEAGALTYGLKLAKVEKAAKAKAIANKNEARIAVLKNLLEKLILNDSARGKIITAEKVFYYCAETYHLHFSFAVIYKTFEKLVKEGNLKKVNIYSKNTWSAYRYMKGYQVII